MSAYYNEIDKNAAAWLRELIKAGHIADGEIDERSIEDVLPSDVRGFTQCHFFAGIGVWSYALRQAGWPDDMRVWTGSCPCQPFSAAGKRTGTDDERHLWPSWFHLIEQCRPDNLFGEQVASKDGLAWFDVVHADLEGTDYTVGATDLCAAGFGAPHIRQRLYFVGDSERLRLGRRRLDDSLQSESGGAEKTKRSVLCQSTETPSPITGTVADSECSQRRPIIEAGGQTGSGTYAELGRTGSTVGLADSIEQGRQGRLSGGQGSQGEAEHGYIGRYGPTNGFWRDADWLWCRDEKYRPVESGTFPLAHGAPARVGRLRGYGNALVAEVAKGFIESYLAIKQDQGD